MGFVHGDIEVEGSDRIVLTVREELARRRLSRQWLADRAKVSLSTLEKALSGRRPFTLATVVRLEEALGLSLRDRSNGGDHKAAGMFAPEDMGAYARPAVRWLEGEYLTLRPSFGEPGAIYAYLTTIVWDEDKGHLTFAERERVDRDFAQQGFVCFPHLSGHIYLVTNSEGQYRLVLLNRPASGGALNGVLTTLVNARGAELTPAAAPIVLLPRSRQSEPQLGLVRPGDSCYDEYRECVDGISRRGYAVFPT
jgi:transcriptional regulator with XRE-family HTH domain